MPGEFMTIEEAARFINMSTDAVKLLIEKGITQKNENGKLLVRTSEIQDWFNRGIRDFDSRQLVTLEKGYDNKRPLIHPLLDPSCIKRNLISTSKSMIIAELVDILITHGRVDEKHRRTIMSAVIDRERMCSTALADGIAIPHPREPLKTIIKKPRLVMGLSWHGVDFESIDGRLTHVVILLCAPRTDVHLQILARLTRLLRNPRMRVALCRAKDEQDVVEVFASFEKKIC